MAARRPPRRSRFAAAAARRPRRNGGSARNGAVSAQARFEQPMVDRRHAQHHRRLEALDRLGDARRGGPALQQDVARAHAQRRKHVADRIGEVEARGGEQPVVPACSRAPARNTARRCRRCGDDAPPPWARRWCPRSSPRTPDRPARAAPGPAAQRLWFFHVASSRSRRINRVCGEAAAMRRAGELREFGVDHQRHRPHDRKDLRKLVGAGAARHRHRDRRPPPSRRDACATMSGVSSISMPTRSFGLTPASRSPAANWLTRAASAP